MSVSRAFALVFAITFISAAVIALVPIPFLTSDPPTDARALDVDARYVYLLRIYPVNVVHSLWHLAFGIAALAAYLGKIEIRLYARTMAVVLVVLALMGSLPRLDTTFGLVPLFGHDIWLHAVEAGIAAWVGWAPGVERLALPFTKSIAPTPMNADME